MKFLLKLAFTLSIFNPYLTFAKLCSISEKQKVPTINIPDGLRFGASTSAFQIEGALRSHGRTESAIEVYLSPVLKNSSFDSPEISSDSYHKYKEDVQILNYIGLDLYRFSMSWTRLLPTGYANYVNQEAVNYYHALLDELEKAGIEPMVQLNHYDHPAVFNEFGAWQNESMVELFKDYARFVFKEYGHRVKYFLTFNEPNVLCHLFEARLWEKNGKIRKESTFPRSFICSHNILKAHAEAYHLYHDEFNSDNNGAISINLACNDYIVDVENNMHLLDIAFAFGCGWFADPIFSSTGDYSDILKQRVNTAIALRGNKTLSLPTFSPYWVNRIRGTADFFGFSYYSARVVEEATDYESSVNYLLPPEALLVLKTLPTWRQTINLNYIVPSGLRNVLKAIKSRYNNPTVHIVENGFADDGRISDIDRIKFIYLHVKQVIAAINNDYCNVKSYIYWSLMDNYEIWGGYSIHFGLAHVDFKSENRTRTLKKSALWLKDVLLKRELYFDDRREFSYNAVMN